MGMNTPDGQPLGGEQASVPASVPFLGRVGSGPATGAADDLLPTNLYARLPQGIVTTTIACKSGVRGKFGT